MATIAASRQKSVCSGSLLSMRSFAINEILRYRGSPFPASRTLCHPAWYIIIIIKGEVEGGGWLSWDQKNHHHDHPHPWYIIIIIRGELEGAGWLHCDWHPERPVPLPTEGWRSLPGVRRSELDRQHRGNPIQSNPIQSNPIQWPPPHICQVGKSSGHLNHLGGSVCPEHIDSGNMNKDTRNCQGQ